MFRICLIFAALAIVATQGRNIANEIRFRDLVKHGKADGRIVGGEDVELGELPFQISFQEIDIDFHFCGGSILNENWIITAAHCVVGEDFENPENLRIMAGGVSLSQDEGVEQFRVVEKIVQHEDFIYATFYCDIALLYFSEPLTFDDNVAPIALPTPSKEYTEDDLFTVSGWGRLSYGGSSPDIMQKVQVPFVDDATCEELYAVIDDPVYENMVCAGDTTNGGIDSCSGDSGGPMFITSTTPFEQAGIVSWGRDCAMADFPGVYTQISYFIDWIEANAVNP